MLKVGIGGLNCEAEEATTTSVTARCNATVWRGELRGAVWLSTAFGHGIGCAQLSHVARGDTEASIVGGAAAEQLQSALSDPADHLKTVARRARNGVDALLAAWTEMARSGSSEQDVHHLVPSTMFFLDAFGAQEPAAYTVLIAAQRVSAAMVAAQQAEHKAQVHALCGWAATASWAASEATALLPELQNIPSSASAISTRLGAMHAASQRLLAVFDIIPPLVQEVRSLFNRIASAVHALNLDHIKDSAVRLEPAANLNITALQNATQAILDFVEQGVLRLLIGRATNSAPTIDIKLVVGALKKWLQSERAVDSSAMGSLKVSLTQILATVFLAEGCPPSAGSGAHCEDDHTISEGRGECQRFAGLCYDIVWLK